MPSKTIVLITGSNQGIGFAMAKLLATTSSSYHIIVCGRTLEKAQTAVSSIQALSPKSTLEPLELDITNTQHIASAAGSISKTHNRLDVLINNAGIYPPSVDLPAQLRAGLETNTIAQASVSEALRPLLKLSSNPRILFLSSSVGSITLRCDPGNKSYNGSAIAYRVSKAGLNMLAACYAKEWREEFGAKVWAVDPGLVVTNLTGDADALRARGALEPESSAETIRAIVEGARDGDVGRLVYKDGVWPW